MQRKLHRGSNLCRKNIGCELGCNCAGFRNGDWPVGRDDEIWLCVSDACAAERPSISILSVNASQEALTDKISGTNCFSRSMDTKPLNSERDTHLNRCFGLSYEYRSPFVFDKAL